jgi:hypothetical protein
MSPVHPHVTVLFGEAALGEYRERVAPWRKNFWNTISDFGNSVVGGIIFMVLLVVSMVIYFAGIPGFANYFFATFAICFVFMMFAERLKRKEPSWITLSLPEFSKEMQGRILFELSILQTIAKLRKIYPLAAFEIEFLETPRVEKVERGMNFILWLYPVWQDWSNKDAALVVENGQVLD